MGPEEDQGGRSKADCHEASKGQEWRAKTTRVHQQLANNDASDLEHEARGLWLDRAPAPASEDG
eukprot:3162724-Pyramimonas_sp.AAC.1